MNSPVRDKVVYNQINVFLLYGIRSLLGKVIKILEVVAVVVVVVS